MSQQALIPDDWDAYGEYVKRTKYPPIPQECKSCHAMMWWGYTRNGKTCPYNYIDGQFTNESHFATCPQAREHSKRMRRK